MSKRIGTAWVAALALLLAPAAASAERVAVVPTSGINLHQGYLEAAGDVFRGHLLGTGRYDVVLVPGESGKYEASATDAVRLASAAAADLAAVLHVTRLGSTARVRLTVYRVATGHVVHRDELGAGTPDDIDPVLQRMATGLATGKSARDTADIHTVTRRESDPLLKMAATNVFGIKLGFVAPRNSVSDDAADFIPGFSAFWLYDVRSFLAEIDVGFHSKDGDGDVAVGLGTYYPLSRGNISPYVGGGLKWAFSEYGGDGASGIQLYGAGGVLVGRLSSVQLRGEVAYFVNTFAERSYDSGKDSGTNVHGMSFSVGIGF
jgi:hypothetical protein